MPILAGNQIYNTVKDVNVRIRSLMNDDNGQLYPDGATSLVNAVSDAYTWLYGLILKLSGTNFDTIAVDLPYTASATPGEIQDLAQFLPGDLYYPTKLEFRLNIGETYQEINRKTTLPSRNTEQYERPPEWIWSKRTILINSGTKSGLLKLTYRGLLPVLQAPTDVILIQNAVEALAHYAASELNRRRGQWQQYSAMLGDDGSRNGGIGTGAKGFAGMILDHLIMDEQGIPRRGVRFGADSVDTVSNRQYTG